MKKVIALFLTMMLLLCCGVSAFADDVTVMRIAGTCNASEKVSEYLAMLEFEKLVEEYSGGTIDAQVYAASQLGSGGEIAEGLMLGSLECGVLGLDNFQSYNDTVAVTSLPYIFENLDVVIDTLNGENEVGKIVYKSLLDENNIRVLAGFPRGYRAIGISKRATGAGEDEVFTPADFKGLIIRTPGVKTIQDVVASFGAQPVAVANAEIATTLAQGGIDGIDYGFTELWGQQWDGLKYVVETNHAATDVVCMVSDSWFQGLTPEQQEAVTKAAKEAGEYRVSLLESDAERAHETLEGWGIKPIYGDSIDLDAFKACAEEISQSWIGVYISQELYDLVMEVNAATSAG